MKTTKNDILEAALTIFSRDGYEGTKLTDIAGLLGITKAALYKHYESKEAIWNAMMDVVEARYYEQMGRVPEEPVLESLEELRRFSLHQIDFTIHDDTVRKARRILMTEQFRGERAKNLAIRHFMVDMEAFYTGVFKAMMERGLIKNMDSELLAFEYTAPITNLIHYCDLDPGREKEITVRIEKHIDHFCEQYRA